MSDYIELDSIEHYGYDSVEIADMNSEEMAEPFDDSPLEPCFYCGHMFDLDTEDGAVVRNRCVFCSVMCADFYARNYHHKSY